MGPGVFRAVPLPSRGAIIVGRGASADLALDEPRASRRHLRVRVADGFSVEDLGSANGTRVRGRKLERGKAVAIAPGEAIAIGSVVLMVQPDRAEPVTEVAPEVPGALRFEPT